MKRLKCGPAFYKIILMLNFYYTKANGVEIGEYFNYSWPGYCFKALAGFSEQLFKYSAAKTAIFCKVDSIMWSRFIRILAN